MRDLAAMEKLFPVGSEDRVITGIATTPRKDTSGEVLDPLGIEFDLPLPLRLEHNPNQVIGRVTDLEVNKNGVRFRAIIFNPEEQGDLKRLCNLAWSSYKAGTRKCVSVGLFPIMRGVTPEGGGKILRWEMLELSLCQFPVQPDAKVDPPGAAPAPLPDYSARQEDPSIFRPSPAAAEELARVERRMAQIKRSRKELQEQANAIAVTDPAASIALAETDGALSSESGKLMQRAAMLRTGALSVDDDGTDIRPGVPVTRSATPTRTAPPVTARRWQVTPLERATDPEGRRRLASFAKMANFLEACEIGPDHRMTAEQVVCLIAAYAPPAAETENAFGEIRRRLDAAEAGRMEYAGVWKSTEQYRRGSVVTDAGSAWCAIRDADPGERPGQGPPWTLMVKRGAPGKDAAA